MEDRDLKSAVRQIKEKKKRETLERLIIFLSGLLITLVFIAVGLNFYSKSDKTVSEPQIKVVSQTNNPPTPPEPQQLQTKPPIEENQLQQSQQIDKKEEQESPKQNQVIKENKEAHINQTIQQKQTVIEQPKQEKIIPSQEKPTTSSQIIKKEELKESKKENQVAKKDNINQDTKQIAKKDDNTVKEVIEKIKSGYFSIQVGAFSTREKAEIEKAKYSNAYIIEESGLHKVLVGKFSTEKEARDYQRQHDIKGFIKRLRY